MNIRRRKKLFTESPFVRYIFTPIVSFFFCGLIPPKYS